MKKLDLDALLDKNPHLDRKDIVDSQKRKRRADRKKGRVSAPASPFGGRRTSQTEQDAWGQTSAIGYRPHYRGI